MNIFEFDRYQDFLIYIAHGPDAIRGMQAKLAQAAGCQASYLSQVLKDKVHLTEDQVLGIAEFLELAPLPTEYFLLLLRYEKAGTANLKAFLLSQIRIIKNEELNLKHRVGATNPAITGEHMALYSQSWAYSAIHILTSSDDMSTEKIAARLGLPKELVTKILKDLAGMNLVLKSGNFWRHQGAGVHISKESPWNPALQAGRRLLVQNSIARNSEEATHFSSVFTIDERELAKLRKMIAELVQKSHEVIHRSGTSELACLCVDLFKV